MVSEDEALEVGGQVTHCGQPMRKVSHRTGWKRDDQIEDIHLRCRVCGAQGDLHLVTPVGPPSGG